MTYNDNDLPGYGVLWDVKTYIDNGGSQSFGSSSRVYVRPDLPNVHSDTKKFLNGWSNYYMNRNNRGPSITTLSGMNYSSGEMGVKLYNIFYSKTDLGKTILEWTPYNDKTVYYRISIIEYGGQSNSSISIPSSSLSRNYSFNTVRSLPKKLSVKYHPKEGKYLITGLVDSLYTQVPSILIPPDAKFDNSVEAGGNYSKYNKSINTSFAFQFVIKLDIYLGLDNFKESNPEFGDVDDNDLNQWFDCNVYSQEEYDNFIQRKDVHGNLIDSPLEITYDDSQGSYLVRTEGETKENVISRSGRGNDQRSQIIFIYLAPNDLRDFFITRYGNERFLAEIKSGTSSYDDYDFVVDKDGNIEFKFYYVDNLDPTFWEVGDTYTYGGNIIVLRYNGVTQINKNTELKHNDIIGKVKNSSVSYGGYMTGTEYLNYLYSKGFLRKFL